MTLEQSTARRTEVGPVQTITVGPLQTIVLSCPAAYIRARDLTVERLEQTYARAADGTSHLCHDYAAPAFAFACRLVYDDAGLVLDYPGIAVRAG